MWEKEEGPTGPRCFSSTESLFSVEGNVQWMLDGLGGDSILPSYFFEYQGSMLYHFNICLYNFYFTRPFAIAMVRVRFIILNSGSMRSRPAFVWWECWSGFTHISIIFNLWFICCPIKVIRSNVANTTVHRLTSVFHLGRLKLHDVFCRRLNLWATSKFFISIRTVDKTLW